jgi:hypothetical protein
MELRPLANEPIAPLLSWKACAPRSGATEDSSYLTPATLRACAVTSPVHRQDCAGHAMEVSYHVTLVRDATAAFTHDMMHAAHEPNEPTFAHSILTITEVIAALPTAPHSEEIVK